MVNPVPGYSVSTGYHKTGSHWTSCGWHTGQDYAAPEGQTIVAARGGTVVHVNYGGAFGSHQFVVRPGDGTEDFYAHCRTRPANGASVETGAYISEIGNEGNSTGPHLHFERHNAIGQWSCGVMVDPMQSHNASGQSTVKDDDMAAATVVFFRTTGAWYASYPNAGVYRIMPDNQTLEDLKTVVTRAGGNWTIHSDDPVENIDAFGVPLD